MNPRKSDIAEKAQRYYDALKRITAYDSPEKLRRRSYSTRNYGVEPAEAMEMAYDNVREEAKAAIRGHRRNVVNHSSGHLIAAAPELLKALKEIREACCSGMGSLPAKDVERAQKAIEKAEGR